MLQISHLSGAYMYARINIVHSYMYMRKRERMREREHKMKPDVHYYEMCAHCKK